MGAFGGPSLAPQLESGVGFTPAQSGVWGASLAPQLESGAGFTPAPR